MATCQSVNCGRELSSQEVAAYATRCEDCYACRQGHIENHNPLSKEALKREIEERQNGKNRYVLTPKRNSVRGVYSGRIAKGRRLSKTFRIGD